MASGVAVNSLFNNLALMQIIAGLTPLKQIREVPVCLSVCLSVCHLVNDGTPYPEQLMGQEDIQLSGHCCVARVWFVVIRGMGGYVILLDVQRNTCVVVILELL